MSRWWSGNSLDVNKKARLQLLRLEDRVVPTGSLDIAMLDAVGYVNKTIALTLSHTGSGTSAGSIDWGDGSATTTLAGWDYATATKVFTHSYSSASTFKITATDTNLSNSDNQSLAIQADVPPAFAVDVQPSMNHVTKRTLWLDDEEFEQTEYVYGVDVGVDGNEISSNDLLGVVLYPDPETGSPSPAQYQYSYNQLGEVIRMEDINGTVHAIAFAIEVATKTTK